MTDQRIISQEVKRQALQAEIDATKSQAERNRVGQFATPNALAVEIAKYVKSLSNDAMRAVHFADPSIGSGSFFSAALAVFGRKRIKTSIGIEIDPAFVSAARELWCDAGLQVVQGDFTRILTRVGCPVAPNLILANPPYVRHHHILLEDKLRLQGLVRQLTGVSVNGLAGLYVYFLLLATAWMQEHGIAAWLIPSEFMDVNYGASLKAFLIDDVTLLRVHRFDPDDVQFDDALVSSAVVVFRKARPTVTHEAEFSFGGTLAKPHASEHLTLEQMRASRKWTAYPRYANNDRETSSDGVGPILSDFFRIQRGIATGDNKFFILDCEDANALGLPSEYLRPILPSPRHLKGTVIAADDRGFPVVERQLCLIDCDLPEYEVKANFPSLWRYLDTADSLGVKDGYLVRKRKPWYRQEQRAPCPFLCTYMGRGADDKRPFRFILNHSSAIGTNLYLMLYPREALSAILRDHAARYLEIHDLLGRITGRELRGEGRVYGGGLNKIEPSELGRVSARSFVERWPQLKGSVRREAVATLFS